MRHPREIGDDMVKLADESGGDRECDHVAADDLLLELIQVLMPQQEVVAFEVRRVLDAYARGRTHWWYA